MSIALELFLNFSVNDAITGLIFHLHSAISSNVVRKAMYSLQLINRAAHSALEADATKSLITCEI